MAHVVPEDVGTTLRAKLSPRRRLQVWERHRGFCVICEQRIDGLRERWIVEHVRALELGGADDPQNMGPAHEYCAQDKTREDHRRAARAKRQKLRHLGIKQRKQLIPGSRQTPLKRKMDGTVVRRDLTRRGDAIIDAPPDQRQGDAIALAQSPKALTHAASCQNPRPSALEHESRTDAYGGAMPEKRSGRRTKQKAKIEILPAVPHHLGFLFEDLPLLRGERAERYIALRDSIIQQLNPANAIEVSWVRDVINSIWEVEQLRRWREQILDQARYEAAKIFVARAYESISVSELAAVDIDVSRESAAIAMDWLGGENPARLLKILRDQGLTIEAVTAQAFLLRLAEIERIDRMCAASDSRRDSLLREIERVRATVTQQGRATIGKAVDAEVMSSSRPPVPR